MTGLIGQAAYEEVDLVFREVLVNSKVQKLRCVEMFAKVTLHPMILQYHDDFFYHIISF